MRPLLLSLLIAASNGSALARPLTGAQIRSEAARLARAAQQEPPNLALDTLLRTATLLKPVATKESEKIFRVAVQHAARHRDLQPTFAIVRLWMDLAPANPERELRNLGNLRGTLQALAVYYKNNGQPELAAQRAEEALRLIPERPVDNSGLIEIVAAHAPQRVPELLALAHNKAAPRAPRSPIVPPVDANLPLPAALEEVRKRQPAYQQIGELWRYLQGKPRSAEEARPILLAMESWALSATDARSDPAWFLQSLLNLDGRLGPPGRAWQLPRELRPMVFLAAAKVGQHWDRRPDQLAELALAMEAEKVPVPPDLISARNRIDFDAFRRALESRYDFALPTLDGQTVRLQSLRGKVVVLNFWSSWCVPCRAEIPILERLSKEFGQELAIVTITDEPAQTVNAFVSGNPIALPILLDSRREAFRHYNVNGIPQSFVMDAEGALRQHFPAAATEAALRAAIIAAKAPN